MENENLSTPLKEIIGPEKQISTRVLLWGYIRVFPVTSLMMLISIILFILISIYSRYEGDYAYIHFGASIGNIGQILLWQGELWRLAVNPYHHGGFLHIFFNLYALYYFGSLAERYMKKLQYFLFVLICGTFQVAVCDITIEPGAIGLSGIIFGLFGILWVVKDQDHIIKRFMTNDLIKIMVIQLFLFIVLTYFKVINIANVGHFFGLIYGILFAFTFYKNPNKLKKIIFILFNLLIFPSIYQAYRPVNNPGWQEWHKMGEPSLQELIKQK